MPTVRFVDEAGNVLATEEYTMTRDDYAPAIKLPTEPRRFDCLGCGLSFMAHPGSASCPRCPSVYYRDGSAELG